MFKNMYSLHGSITASVLLLVTAAAFPAERIRDVGRVSDGPATGMVEYMTHCAVCHGDTMLGEAQGSPLVGEGLRHGESMVEIAASITKGYEKKGMPAWSKIFSGQEIKSLALLIAEQRAGFSSDLNINADLVIPAQVFESGGQAFVLEVVTDELDRLPYSMTVLPNDSIVVSEKMRGLRIVSADGEVSPLISGTPKTRDDVFLLAADNLEFGTGWLLDVQAHPNYAQNGWLYLHHTECRQRCEAVADEDNPPQSRNVLVRGRIKDNRWVDQELIWQAASFDASQYLDMVAGGRIAFDPEGYVFITVGMRSMDAIQDLRSPYGKIHRIHDDGRVPMDNPFVNRTDAIKTIWTLGHRSPQGLFFDVPTRLLYETEHGPRGGDEINVLRPGKNYGWPLFSSGQNYDGTEVAHGRTVSELELRDTEQPVVDWVPSPAISNLTVYRGDAFPNWQGQMLVGSLKASNLYRLEAQSKRQEIMVPNLARIRDIDVDRKGLVYLLLEHSSGGQIVRLKPHLTASEQGG